MAIPQFTFDADTETPEQLAKRRALAEAMLARGTTGIASNVGEGLAQLGQALAGRIAMSRADGALKKRESGALGGLAKLFGGGSPKADVSGGEGSDSLMGAGGKAPANASALAPLIAETAADVGIDPLDLATAISYETAGTFDPMKKGPTTQWGRHKGLIQFGEPQAKQYGVDWNDPVGSQLGTGKAIASYLKKAGVKPGMGMMDVYSAINAGRVGRYGASDANNGGAPGTVADKVNKQMGGHRAKAQALLAAMKNNGGDGVNIVPASAPPPGAPMPEPEQPPMQPGLSSPMVPQQIATGGEMEMPVPASAPGVPMQQPQRPPSAYARMMRNSVDRGTAPGAVQSQVEGGMQPQGGATGGIFGMMGLGPREPQQPAMQPAMGQEMAQGGAPQMAPAPAASAQPGNRLAEFEAFITSNDFGFLRPAQQKFVMDEYQRLQDAANPDPMRDLQIQKTQLEIDRMRNPRVEPGYRPATPEEKAALGLDPAAPAQVGPNGKIEPIKTESGITVNNNMGGEKFGEEFAKLDAQSLGEVSKAGLAAQRNLGRIDQLDALLKASPTGADGAIRQAAGEWGINTEGLDTLQAAQALINSLVPEQRQPGSGPMSDADLALFKQSLPRIINQPGGNDMIVGTMRAIAQYDAEGAAIVQALRSERINRAQAFDALQNRANPLADFKAPNAAAPQEPPAVAPVPQPVPNMGGDTYKEGDILQNGAGERVILRNNQWVPYDGQ